MKLYQLLFLILTLFGLAISFTPVQAQAAAITNQVYSAKGVIRQLSPDHSTATIKHEAIKGYMPAMTMDFNVRDTNELSGLKPGDVITFQLTATEETHWIEHLKKIGSKGIQPAVEVSPRNIPTPAKNSNRATCCPTPVCFRNLATRSSSRIFAGKRSL